MIIDFSSRGRRLFDRMIMCQVALFSNYIHTCIVIGPPYNTRQKANFRKKYTAESFPAACEEEHVAAPSHRREYFKISSLLRRHKR